MEMFTKFVSNEFYVRPNRFSDIAILCSRPNSCCQQNLYSVSMSLYNLFSSGVFFMKEQQ